MPWHIVEKSYGRNKRYDAIYHIRFADTSINFDVICKYVNGHYRWLLFSSSPQAHSIQLGIVPDMNDLQACEVAYTYVRQILKEKLASVNMAEEVLRPQLKRAISNL